MPKKISDKSDTRDSCCFDSDNAYAMTSRTNSECLILPFHIDRHQTLELLTYILHGQDNAKIVFQKDNQIKIEVKPSIWPFTYIVDILLDNDNQNVHICRASGWFNQTNNFSVQIYNNYLNVAKKG
jgi:uncharacterized protein (DUF1499 family)